MCRSHSFLTHLSTTRDIEKSFTTVVVEPYVHIFKLQFIQLLGISMSVSPSVAARKGEDVLLVVVHQRDDALADHVHGDRKPQKLWLGPNVGVDRDTLARVLRVEGRHWSRTEHTHGEVMDANSKKLGTDNLDYGYSSQWIFFVRPFFDDFEPRSFFMKCNSLLDWVKSMHTTLLLLRSITQAFFDL